MITLNLNSPKEYRCNRCRKPGYGAGPCASCANITCYDCARHEARKGFKGEFWFCPTCFANKMYPTAFVEGWIDRNIISTTEE